MSAFTELLDGGRHPLWLDYTQYAGALLAGGRIPWLDATALVAWQRKAQGLLKSDVLALPLAAVIDQWLDAHGELRQAMAAKRRAVFPLKTLLADEALRAHLAELARGLRSSFERMPLALVCPSPTRAVVDAYRSAFGTDAEVAVGEDETDSASLYLADFLRAFGEAGVDVLLLAESADSEPDSSQALALYQAVLNVAAHYRWSLGLLAPAGRYGGGGVDFVIAPKALPGARAGLLLAHAFEAGASVPDCPPQGFRYAEIPAAAQPERVLQQLAALR